jgi:hypothetical protein
MSKRTSKSDKGCVGFVADGVIRKATIYAFKTNDKDPAERISELQQYFGSVKGKYVCVSDVDEVYDKFVEALSEFRVKETPLFGVSITKGNDVLKTVSETTKAHNIKCGDGGDGDEDEKQEVDEGDETDKTTKPTKKTAKTKQADEDAEEKPVKKSTNKKPASKKDEDEQESSKSESENDDDDDDEKESKPKLKKKNTKSTDEGKSKKSKSK